MDTVTLQKFGDMSRIFAIACQPRKCFNLVKFGESLAEQVILRAKVYLKRRGIIMRHNRRHILVGAASSLAAPYFFLPTTVKADVVSDGLAHGIRVVSDNLSMTPRGGGNVDTAVAGGGTIFAKKVRDQADMMVRDGRFTRTFAESPYTRQVVAHHAGYMFARFTDDFHGCCLPMNAFANAFTDEYAGALTLLEGPNLVGLQVMTVLLKERHYTPEQMIDLCWPTELSSVANRERAVLSFRSIKKIVIEGTDQYCNRDVLKARSALCVLDYTHVGGVPDGGGKAALIVNGKEEFRFEFKYDRAVLAA